MWLGISQNFTICCVFPRVFKFARSQWLPTVTWSHRMRFWNLFVLKIRCEQLFVGIYFQKTFSSSSRKSTIKIMTGSKRFFSEDAFMPERGVLSHARQLRVLKNSWTHFNMVGNSEKSFYTPSEFWLCSSGRVGSCFAKIKRAQQACWKTKLRHLIGDLALDGFHRIPWTQNSPIYPKLPRRSML